MGCHRVHGIAVVLLIRHAVPDRTRVVVDAMFVRHPRAALECFVSQSSVACQIIFEHNCPFQRDLDQHLQYDIVAGE